MEAPPQHGATGPELLQAFAVYLNADTNEVVNTLLQSVQLPAGATVAQGAWDSAYVSSLAIAAYLKLLRAAL